jgi:hypothetical protein
VGQPFLSVLSTPGNKCWTPLRCAVIVSEFNRLHFMITRTQRTRPLCPAHYGVMLVNPTVLHWSVPPHELDTTDSHDCECPEDGCPHHYSPGFGYFTLEKNIEHENATGSATLRINKSATQVICARHKHSMFLESFDPKTRAGKFRCPDTTCPQVMTIVTDGPPAYWLSEGNFGTVRI